MTAVLDDIGARLADGRPINDDDLQALAGTRDLVSLGMIADDVRRRRHDRRTTFIRVAEAPLAVADSSPAAWPPAARELRISGAFVQPDAAFAAVERIVASAAGVAVTGFSLADLEAAAGGDLATVRDWVRTLKAAGLAEIAEAPVDRMVRGRDLLEAVAGEGLRVARLSVDASRDRDPLDVVQDLKALAAAGTVTVVAPLPRHQGPEPSTGYADVRTVALARILLDIDHVQVDWPMYGPKLAQVALTFGADDVDRVSPLDETAEGRRRAPLEEIRRNIRAAGLEAFERDTRFSVV